MGFVGRCRDAGLPISAARVLAGRHCVLHRPQNDERPGGRPVRGALRAVVVVVQARATGSCRAGRTRTRRAASPARPAARSAGSAGEAQRVPAERVLAAERQLGHEVDRGSSTYELGSRPSKCASARTCISVGTWASRRRERTSSTSGAEHAARAGRRGGPPSPEHGRRAAGCRPSECYGSFCSSASFRGLSPAPSHHLGVDVFVGTLGCPSSPSTSGISQSIGTSSRSVGPSLRSPAT